MVLAMAVPSILVAVMSTVLREKALNGVANETIRGEKAIVGYSVACRRAGFPRNAGCQARDDRQLPPSMSRDRERSGCPEYTCTI